LQHAQQGNLERGENGKSQHEPFPITMNMMMSLGRTNETLQYKQKPKQVNFTEQQP
jgi:hypothetical protein